MPTELSAGTPASVVVRSRKVAPPTPAPEHGFLVLDNRFGTMIYVILETDPRIEREFPKLDVREIELERRPTAAGTAPQDAGICARAAVGRDPAHLNRFREFGSDRAVAGAGFILIEPRYVGPNWPAYVSAFRPDGDRPVKRHRESHRAPRA